VGISEVSFDQNIREEHTILPSNVGDAKPIRYHFTPSIHIEVRMMNSRRAKDPITASQKEWIGEQGWRSLARFDHLS
jgi:hypothetical protein